MEIPVSQAEEQAAEAMIRGLFSQLLLPFKTFTERKDIPAEMRVEGNDSREKGLVSVVHSVKATRAYVGLKK